jgi:hypothetical protein
MTRDTNIGALHGLGARRGGHARDAMPRRPRRAGSDTAAAPARPRRHARARPTPPGCAASPPAEHRQRWRGRRARRPPTPRPQPGTARTPQRGRDRTPRRTHHWTETPRPPSLAPHSHLLSRAGRSLRAGPARRSSPRKRPNPPCSAPQGAAMFACSPGPQRLFAKATPWGPCLGVSVLVEVELHRASRSGGGARPTPLLLSRGAHRVLRRHAAGSRSRRSIA